MIEALSNWSACEVLLYVVAPFIVGFLIARL